MHLQSRLKGFYESIVVVVHLNDSLLTLFTLIHFPTHIDTISLG